MIIPVLQILHRVDYPQSTNVAPASLTQTTVDYTDGAPASLTETPNDYPSSATITTTETPVDYPQSTDVAPASLTETPVNDYPMPSEDVSETLPEPQVNPSEELEPNQNSTKPPYGYVPPAPPSSFDENGSRMIGAVTVTAVMIGFVLFFA